MLKGAEQVASKRDKPLDEIEPKAREGRRGAEAMARCTRREARREDQALGAADPQRHRHPAPAATES